MFPACFQEQRTGHPSKQYKFSVSPTIAMTKDLWRKIMDEVSVSEVI